MCATGEPPASAAAECLAFHQKRLKTRNEDAQKYGVPLFFTEFGSCLNSTACVDEITSVTNTCDQYLVGWAYWQFKFYHDITSTSGTGSEGFYNFDGTL